jgi:hypothetical protein
MKKKSARSKVVVNPAQTANKHVSSARGILRGGHRKEETRALHQHPVTSCQLRNDKEGKKTRLLWEPRERDEVFRGDYSAALSLRTVAFCEEPHYHTHTRTVS